MPRARRRSLGAVVAALSFVSALGAARADEPPSSPAAPASPSARASASAAPTVDAACEQVLAAYRAKDDEAGDALAGRERPGRWLVAEALAERGAAAAGSWWASGALGAAVEMLPAYFERRVALGVDDAPGVWRAELRRIGAEQDVAALATLAEALEPGLFTVRRVEVAIEVAHACAGAGLAERAAALLERAARAAEALGWLSRAAEAHASLGRMAQRLGAHGASADAFGTAARIAESLGDRAHAERDRMLEGSAARRAERLDGAAVAFAAAAAHARSLGDAPGEARAQEQFGAVCLELGRAASAEDAARRALELADRAGDARLRASACDTLLRALRLLGRVEASLRVAEEEVSIAESLGGADRARALRQLALSQDAVGLSSEAVESFGRAERALGQNADPAAVAAILEDRAELRSRLGAASEAVRDRERVVALRQTASDGVGEAAARQQLAVALEAAGRGEEALAELARAIELWNAAGTPDRAHASLASRGAIRRTSGDLVGAVTDLAEAGRCAAALGDDGSAALCGTLLAGTHLLAGRLDEARVEFEAARVLLESAGRRDDVPIALVGLAAVELAAGRLDAAIVLARDAAGRIEATARGLADLEGAQVRTHWVTAYDVGVRASVRAGRVDDVVTFLERGRAGMLLEGLAVRERALPQGVSTALAAAERSAEVAEREARWQLETAMAGGALAPIRAARASHEAASAALVAVRDRIERAWKAAGALPASAVDDVATIRARVRADEVLVLYGLTAEEAVAVVVDRDRARLVALGTSAAIGAACEALSGADAGGLDPTAAARLERLVAAPLGLARTVRRVVISPSGALGLAPFALVFPDREVVLVPSATTLGRLRARGTTRGDGVLALGDPSYRSPADLRGLVPLPGTRVEAQRIGSTCLLGTEATERALREALGASRHWRAVHLACHGLFDVALPRRSALALTRADDDDGNLDVGEIARLRVDADLVALSACDTGRGTLASAEGVLGLTRAFLQAGAKTVLCSLWKVDDDATRALMTRFYERWSPVEGPGVSAAAALRDAQAYVRADPRWAHPSFWAGWSLWGLAD